MYCTHIHVLYTCTCIIIMFIGLYPNGIPCQKKTKLGFESITRDVSPINRQTDRWRHFI